MTEAPRAGHTRAAGVAGRRIDAPRAEAPRFPLENVPIVRDRLRDELARHQLAWVVSSAACGADIIAQEVAAELGLRRRVVLPFSRAQFRERSVVDRPGDWGQRFDQLMLELEPENNVIDLKLDPEAPDVYTRANEAILEQVLTMSGGSVTDALAVIVWEGNSRGEADYTAAFAAAAGQRGLAVRRVLTI